MASDQATLDAYAGLRFELPSGKVVHCKCLKLSEAIIWARLQVAARMGDPEAQIAVMNFPAAIAPDDDPEAFEELAPAEAFDLLDRFLAHRRPDMVRRLNPAAKLPTTETSSTSGSTT